MYKTKAWQKDKDLIGRWSIASGETGVSGPNKALCIIYHIWCDPECLQPKSS